MLKITGSLAAAAALAVLLAGCGTNGASVIPGTSQANLGSDKLEFAVGTYFNANGGTTGLNFVTSFRQANGLSAVEADNVSVTGPFTVPVAFAGAYSGSPNVDAGTHTVSSSPQVPPNATAVNSTLGTFTGAFSYGFAPLNSDQQGLTAYYPGNPNQALGNGFVGSQLDANVGWWELPIGAPAGQQDAFLLGPPAVPFFNNGTFPVNFSGYSPGFTLFQIPPVAGTYTETVNVVAANAPSTSFTASGTLANVTPLGAPSVSAVAENGGGFTGTVTVPAGATETIVFIWDTTSNMYFSVGPIAGTGAHAFTLPATLGKCSGGGCQSGSNATPSLAAGDQYVIAPVSFDYPAFEAGPPANTSPTPTLTGAAGQTDLSIGIYQGGTY